MPHRPRHAQWITPVAAGLESLEGRLLFAAGDLDPTFGAGGEVRVAAAGTDTVLDVKATGSRVVVASNDGQGGPITLRAFDSAGRADRTFSGDGVLATGLAGPRADLHLAGSKVLLTAGPTLARFNSDGSPDRSFGGGDGLVNVGFGGSLASAPGGKFVVAGAGPAPNYHFAAARVNGDGSFDRSFGGGDGVFITDCGGASDAGDRGALDVAVQPDGKVLLAGAQPAGPADSWDGAVVRLQPAGSYDTTFGGDGLVTIDGGRRDVATQVAPLPDGGVLVGFTADRWDVYPVRLNRDGSRDTRYLAPVFDDSDDGSRIVDLSVTPDGKAFATLLGKGSEGNIIARYTPEGALDTEFGGARFVRTTGLQSTLTPGGRLITVGGTGFIPDTYFVQRYQTAPDPRRTTLQAEDGMLEGAVVRADNAGYTGRGYVDFLANSGERLTWKVYAFQTDSHFIKIRYANGGHTNRPMTLRYGNGAFQQTLQFRPTGSWTTWGAETIFIPLNADGPAAGANLIWLESVGSSGPNVDSMIITRPPVVPPAELVRQAETGVLWGARVDNAQPGYTGTGYVDFANPSGDFVEWAVNVSSDRFVIDPRGPGGIYSITFRYANGGPVARPLELFINDESFADLSFEPTGSWGTWRTVTRNFVGLRVGGNLIKLQSILNNGPNLDWMMIEQMR